MTRDLALRDALAELPARSWSGTVYRAVWASREALLGSSGGGRWCPPNGFEVLYTSLQESGAIAEVDAWLSEITPRPDRPVIVHEVRVELTNSISIESFDALTKLGVDVRRYHERVYDRTQEIGDAANFLGFDGLFVPSARWQCINLVLFLGNHHDREKKEQDRQKMEIVKSVPVDWHRWHAERSR